MASLVSKDPVVYLNKESLKQFEEDKEWFSNKLKESGLGVDTQKEYFSFFTQYQASVLVVNQMSKDYAALKDEINRLADLYETAETDKEADKYFERIQELKEQQDTIEAVHKYYLDKSNSLETRASEIQDNLDRTQIKTDAKNWNNKQTSSKRRT